jgi:ketosteroid isomerase-like protein
MLPSSPSAQLVTELTQALNAFFLDLDERRYDAVVSGFLADGRWLRQGKWLQGHAAIRAGLEARPATMRVRHIITNIVVSAPEGEDVRVHAYMTAVRQLEGEAAASLYRMNMVSNVFRRDEGAWRLVEQQLLPDLGFPGPAA